MPWPPHKIFELEQTGLLYRVFYSESLPPARDEGTASDIYILAEYGVLLYKEISTSAMHGKWRLASDDYTIFHPFESSHWLTVTLNDATNKFRIQWTSIYDKVGLFEEAFPAMKDIVFKKQKRLND